MLVVSQTPEPRDVQHDKDKAQVICLDKGKRQGIIHATDNLLMHTLFYVPVHIL